MWSDRFNGEAHVFEESLSDDENEDLVRALQLSTEESNGKGVYWAGMEYSHIDEDDDQLAYALEESIQISSNRDTGRHKWWKPFKDSKKQLGQTSRGISLRTRKVVNCDVCEEQVIKLPSFWGQTICEKHHRDASLKCCSCSRYEIGDIKYASLNDGRKLCPDCCSTAILDHESCQSLVYEVYTFYEGLNMHIRKDIPVLIVDKFEMDKLTPLPDQFTVGLTTYKLDTVTCVTSASLIEENIEVVKQVQYLSRRSIVTSMLLLYGLPKLATGATLAHEMMHAWMRLEGYHGLDLKIEEGICEVMSHKWLEWYGFIGKDRVGSAYEEAEFLKNYRVYAKDRIEKNYDRTYGDGFRDAKCAVERYGLKYTLQTIANTGKFPD